jgi:hypothetical protein
MSTESLISLDLIVNGEERTQERGDTRKRGRGKEKKKIQGGKK